MTTLTKPSKVIFKRLPKDNDELHAVVSTLWGYEIPRNKVCKNHCAPFDAFADAYFARHPVIIIKASRGFGGKSMLLGMLTHTELVLLNAQVTVLGGSSAQSRSVHEFGKEAWASDYAPKSLLKTEPTQFVTELKTGGWIRALLASQTSVRGPHPQRLRLDEIDEMDIDILDASFGQPMDKNGVKSQIVLSSTHQYPDGTMSEILKRANQNDWPVYEWCYKENMGVGGWLSDDEVNRKKAIVTEAMWNTEYELQEPSFKSRSMSVEDLNEIFDESLGEYDGVENKTHLFELPERGCTYLIGADWAKETDWTVIVVYKTNVHPWQGVAFLRTRKRKWQDMIRDFSELREMYGAYGAHDATGIGNVVDDLLDSIDIEPITLLGRTRERIFTDYLFGVESRTFKWSMIRWMYNEHKYVTGDDLFTTGGHPPDSFVANAVAYSKRFTYVSSDLSYRQYDNDGLTTTSSKWSV